MMKLILSLLTVSCILAACTEANDTPVTISEDIHIESLPWTEDQSALAVSLFDANGNLINSPDEVQSGHHYEVVIKSDQPIALYVNKSFGLKFLENENQTLEVSDTHRYPIVKTEPGLPEVIMEVFPFYYIDGVLTHEKPQLFMFPKSVID